MNIDLTHSPLPRPARSATHRRHSINGLPLARHAVRQFRHVADRLHCETPAPDADQIATTGRTLLRQFRGFRRAPPVSMRCRLLRALHTMHRDPDWTLDPTMHAPVRLLHDYHSAVERLIPDAVAVVGGLDEALLVDMAWPQLQAEMEAYLAFRAARAAAAKRCGASRRGFRFDRAQWLRRLEEEQAWRHHQRTHGLCHYDAAPTPLFRIR